MPHVRPKAGKEGENLNSKTREKLEYDKIISWLADCCVSVIGQERALSLLPSGAAEEIRQRQARVTEARGILRQVTEVPLEGIHDLRLLLWKAEKGGLLEGEELNKVALTLQAAVRIREFLLKHSQAEGYLRLRGESLGMHRDLLQKIKACISEQGKIKDSASPRLEKIRRQIYTLNLKIKEKLDEVIRQQEYQKYLQEPLVTIRYGRYVVPVKQEYRYQFPGLIHDQSASGATVFMEPMAVVQINNELQRLAAEEKQEEERILRELTAAVAQRQEEVKRDLEILGEVDFIFACARLSQVMDAREPQFASGRELQLLRARHPLLGARAVPISVELGRDFDILVVTGPNTGGKTVALKTIGLLCLMAQAGLHIPVDEGTVLPVFQKIFVDIGDEQSIEQSLSTFSSHMSNIVEILKETDAHSLVLLDELGAGTDPAEGAALGMAILEYLLEKRALVVATTHYSELKTFAYTRPRVENAAVEFDAETLRPTYRLRIGLPGKSNAFEIAARLGLAPSVVERARQYLTREELEMGDLIQSLKESHLKTEAERREAEQLRKRLQEREEALLRAEQAWREKEARMLRRAQEEAMEIVQQARQEAERILKELRQAKKEAAEPQRVQELRRQLKNMHSRLYDGWQKGPSGAGEGEKSPAEGDAGLLTAVNGIRQHFKPGDQVYVSRLNQQGQVIGVAGEGKEVEVQIGMVRLHLPPSDLQLLSPAEKQKSSASSFPARSDLGRLMSDKSRTVSSEVHLRGMLVDEALLKLEKYLDDAYLAGLSSVYVIHGKGTGTLRAAVREFLSEHPYVASFRPATAQEGGLGVTVVELKQ